MKMAEKKQGMVIALMTPISMGIIPIFAKLSIDAGMDSYTVAALRTVIAALLLWIVFLTFGRKYLFIFPAGLVGTIAVGMTNGLGSMLYYRGLAIIDNASMAQLLFLQYSTFTIIISLLRGMKLSWLSVLRCVLSLAAVVLMTIGNHDDSAMRWAGVGLIIAGALLYAIHVITSQRVMFEMPAPTMALYAMTWMGLTVLLGRIIAGQVVPLSWKPELPMGWLWLICLAFFTGLSRLALFNGVRTMGSIQTILLNMADLAVTLVLARVFLHEMLTGWQWLGVALLVISVALSNWEKDDGQIVYKPLPQPQRFRR